MKLNDDTDLALRADVFQAASLTWPALRETGCRANPCLTGLVQDLSRSTIIVHSLAAHIACTSVPEQIAIQCSAHGPGRLKARAQPY